MQELTERLVNGFASGCTHWVFQEKRTNSNPF